MFSAPAVHGGTGWWRQSSRAPGWRGKSQTQPSVLPAEGGAWDSSPTGLKSLPTKDRCSKHLLMQVLIEYLVLAHVGGVTCTAVCGRAAASAAPIHQADKLLRTQQNRCRWLAGPSALSTLKVLASKMRITSTQALYLATNCNRSLMPDDRMMASLPTQVLRLQAPVLEHCTHSL